MQRVAPLASSRQQSISTRDFYIPSRAFGRQTVTTARCEPARLSPHVTYHFHINSPKNPINPRETFNIASPSLGLIPFALFFFNLLHIRSRGMRAVEKKSSPAYIIQDERCVGRKVRNPVMNRALLRPLLTRSRGEERARAREY